jgi:hypothetical protein
MNGVSALDYEEIRRLKARYFRAIDSHRWQELASLYTDEARFEGFAFPTGDAREFIAGVSNYLTGIRSMHQGFNPEFMVVNEDRVRGVWSMCDYLTWEIGSRTEYRDVEIPGQWGIRGYGYYEEEYERTELGWRVSFQRLTRTIVDALTGPRPIVVPADRMLAPDPSWLA